MNCSIGEQAFLLAAEKHGGIVDHQAPGSADAHRNRAVRFRALAADATTARARDYLIGMANQCDARAAGRAVASALLDAEEYDTPARWGRAR